jgi:hypothetical protein
MQISTAQDALTALTQADDDIIATQKQYDVPTNSATLVLNMYTVTNALLGRIGDQLNSIANDNPTDPLTAPELASLSDLQQQIISDRAVLGLQITGADWTFGGIFNSIAQELPNLASQGETLVGGVSSGLKWLVIILGIVIGFVIFVKVV